VRVVARASRSEVAGEFDGALRVRIAASPVEGAANRELIRLLARELKIPQSAIRIVSGLGSKSKSIRLSRVTADALDRLRTLS
jgi:uncharacterized protein (TIGR00251 family)